MPRLRKLRRKQKYQYHVNRRRLHRKQTKLPDIKCELVRKAWDKKKSLNENLKAMGLVGDPNEISKIPSGKETLKRMTLPPHQRDLMGEGKEDGEPPSKAYVVKQLEDEAKQIFKAKKSVPHPLPKENYRKLCGFLDKYGDDYESMANDYTNYNQETPAQLRAQIHRLKSIPQQWIPYLKSRGLPAPDQEDSSSS